MKDAIKFGLFVMVVLGVLVLVALGLFSFVVSHFGIITGSIVTVIIMIGIISGAMYYTTMNP